MLGVCCVVVCLCGALCVVVCRSLSAFCRLLMCDVRCLLRVRC